MKASFAAIQVLFALHLTAQHNQQSPHEIFTAVGRRWRDC
jgi:hypothetical protein